MNNLKTVIFSLMLFFLVGLVNGQEEPQKTSNEQVQQDIPEDVLIVEIYHGVKGMILISDGTGEQEVIDLLKGNSLEEYKKNNVAVANVLNHLAQNGWHLQSSSGDNSVTRIFMVRK